MRNKKESPIVRVEEKVMEGVLRKIKGSKISRTTFVSDAIEKEIKRLDNENNAEFLKIIKDHYDEKQISYAGKGIKSFEEYASRMATNTDDIKRLEKKVKEFDVSSKMLHSAIKEGYVTVDKTDTGVTLRWNNIRKRSRKQS